LLGEKLLRFVQNCSRDQPLAPLLRLCRNRPFKNHCARRAHCATMPSSYTRRRRQHASSFAFASGWLRTEDGRANTPAASCARRSARVLLLVPSSQKFPCTGYVKGGVKSSCRKSGQLPCVWERSFRKTRMIEETCARIYTDLDRDEKGAENRVIGHLAGQQGLCERRRIQHLGRLALHSHRLLTGTLAGRHELLKPPTPHIYTPHPRTSVTEFTEFKDQKG